MVGLGVGLAIGMGFRPTAAAAQSGVATVTATARVLPAVGLLPSGVEASRGPDGARPGSWRWEADGPADPACPSFPATTVTRRVLGTRRVIELAATGV